MGLAHLLSSFFSCHCAGSSLSRSAVIESQGVASQVRLHSPTSPDDSTLHISLQLFSVVAAVIVLLVLFFLAPYFQPLPRVRPAVALGRAEWMHFDSSALRPSSWWP